MIKFNEDDYRPLPKNVTIKKSKIDGLGLFATEDIPENYIIGITHVADKRFEHGYVRTPLGGFFNHSDYPNCEAFKFEDLIIIKTLRDIKAEEEITAYYWLYKMKEESQ